MKVVCNRENMLAAFQMAASFASPRSPREILQNVKIIADAERVTLIATDMDTGIRIDMDGVDVQSPGQALLAVLRVGAILRESTDEQLEIKTEENQIVVRGLHSEFKLPSINPDEFPTVVGFEADSYHELPAPLFREMVKRTAFATDTDSTRYALGGVLLELVDDEVISVATDGRRLAKMQGTGTSVGGHATTGNTTIVPTRSLLLMERAIGDKEETVQIASRANDVILRTSRCTIYTRLVEGRYPNWRHVTPNREGSAKVKVVAGQFLNAIKQAAIVVTQETRGLTFDFGTDTLLLSASTADVGQSRIACQIKYTGAPVKLKLDYQFVSDFLKVMDATQTIDLDISSATEPAILRTDDGYTYTIMPMEIK